MTKMRDYVQARDNRALAEAQRDLTEFFASPEWRDVPDPEADDDRDDDINDALHFMFCTAAEVERRQRASASGAPLMGPMM